MKKLCVAFMVILGLFSLNSCEKALEKTPDGQTTIDKVLSDFDRTKGLVDAAYGQIYLSRDQVSFVHNTIEALTDNAFWAATFNAYKWHNGGLSLTDPVITWDWSSPSEQLWPDFWRGIRLANNAIKYIPQSTSPRVTPELRENWVAEARVLRCWFYLQLLEFYGPMPWIEEPFDPNFLGWNDLKRPTYNEIVSKMEEELLDVINSGVLDDRRSPVSGILRVDNGIAYAIRARALLYNASLLNNPENDRAKWERAANAAQDVIDLPYQLVNMADYKKLFIGTSESQVSEIIWRSWSDNSHINNANGVNAGAYPFASINNAWNCGESPTQELVDAFEMKNGALPVTYNDATRTRVNVTPGAAALGYSEEKGGDPYANRDARFYINIVHNMMNYGVPFNCTQPYIIETFVGGRNGFNDVISRETQNSCTGYYSGKDKQIKYWGPGSSKGNERTHWVFFRLAEFYLQKAEALCEMGDLGGAMQALNVIRERALQPRIQDVPGFIGSKEFLMDRIRNERRVEFCLEGQYRFNDQRRWKILKETNQFITGMRITKEADGEFSYQRKKIRDYQSFTDQYLVMPIPLEDAKKMTGMTQPKAWQ